MLREPQRLPSPAGAVPVQGLRADLLQGQHLRITEQLPLRGQHLCLDPRRLPVHKPPERAAAVLPSQAPLQAQRAGRRKPSPDPQIKKPLLPRHHPATLAVGTGVAETAEAGAMGGRRRRHGGVPPPRRRPETIQQRPHGSAA
uniref:Uncharacterized protein n=1 Tax=Arundo donax TaxID=35708 RepID=A0A0A9CT68_ARUDO